MTFCGCCRSRNRLLTRVFSQSTINPHSCSCRAHTPPMLASKISLVRASDNARSIVQHPSLTHTNSGTMHGMGPRGSVPFPSFSRAGPNARDLGFCRDWQMRFLDLLLAGAPFPSPQLLSSEHSHTHSTTTTTTTLFSPRFLHRF